MCNSGRLLLFYARATSSEWGHCSECVPSLSVRASNLQASIGTKCGINNTFSHQNLLISEKKDCPRCYESSLF